MKPSISNKLGRLSLAHWGLTWMVSVLGACTSDSSSLDALSSADKNDPDKYTALVYAYETITKPDSTTCRRALQGVKFYVEDSTGTRVRTANDQAGGISSTNADGFGTFTLTKQASTYFAHYDTQARDTRVGRGYSYLPPERAPTHQLKQATVGYEGGSGPIDNPTQITTNSGAINNYDNETVYLEYELLPNRRTGAIPESECEPYELSGGLSANAFLSDPATYKARLLAPIEEARKAKEAADAAAADRQAKLAKLREANVACYWYRRPQESPQVLRCNNPSGIYDALGTNVAITVPEINSLADCDRDKSQYGRVGSPCQQAFLKVFKTWAWLRPIALQCDYLNSPIQMYIPSAEGITDWTGKLNRGEAGGADGFSSAYNLHWILQTLRGVSSAENCFGENPPPTL